MSDLRNIKQVTPPATYPTYVDLAASMCHARLDAFRMGVPPSKPSFTLDNWLFEQSRAELERLDSHTAAIGKSALMRCASKRQRNEARTHSPADQAPRSVRCAGQVAVSPAIHLYRYNASAQGQTGVGRFRVCLKASLLRFFSRTTERPHAN